MIKRQTYGEMVRAFREREGLSLRETARHAGMTASYLSDIENDRRVPSADLAERLSVLLNDPDIDDYRPGLSAQAERLVRTDGRFAASVNEAAKAWEG